MRFMKQFSPPRRYGPGVLVAAGALTLGLGVTAAGVTMASYNDFASLNLGAAGIGYQGRFDIGVVLPSGRVEQADNASGYDWVVPEAETLVPGRSVTTTIPVFNNTESLGADTTFQVVLRNTDGSVSPSIPNITSHLRFTAAVDGDVVFENVSWADARGQVGVLSARQQAPLAEGDNYVAAQPESARDLTLTITYVDGPGTEALNGGQSALAVKFNAASVKP